jgi:sporulation protein YlmC with PRC-barrel domain
MGILPGKALKELSDDLELGRDVLDKQVVDRDGIKMGRVDGLVLELREGKPPRIEAIEMGGVVLAARIHPRLARWVDGWRRRFKVRRTAVYRAPWSSVLEITEQAIKLDVAAAETPNFAWERWLQEHVIAHIPAAAKGGQEE